MATFAEYLNDLPSAEHVTHIDVFDKYGKQIHTIPNVPGKKGSLKLYNYLSRIYDGKLDAVAAARGLEIFAEHVEDAIANPGKHPNIDVLLDLAGKEDGTYFTLKVFED